jgi:amino acid permease
MSSSSGDNKPAGYYEMNDIKTGFHDNATEVGAGRDEKRGSVEIMEGAEMYGNIAEAEEYGYVHRGLKSRHIQFIALVRDAPEMKRWQRY